MTLSQQEIEYTVFADLQARIAKRVREPWSALAARLAVPNAAKSKAALPLISGATFGTRRTPKNALRHGDNIEQFHLLIGDHDGGTLPAKDAAARLEAFGIGALIHTTASSTEAKPRWHVIVRLAKPHPPSDFVTLMARLNGALGGVLSAESFTDAQSYYTGAVTGAAYEFIEARGALALDEVDHLADLERYPPTKANGGDGAVLGLEERILRGAVGDNVHDAMRDRALELRRNGVAAADAAVQLRALMDRVPWREAEPARWRDRYVDIDRLCAVEVKVPNIEIVFPGAASDVVPDTLTVPVLDDAALCGPAGDFVRMVKPLTEASAPALLMSFLTAVGCAVGRNPYVQLGATRHGLNLFVVLLGVSSRGRKGTAADYVRALLDEGLASLAPRRLSSLSSGEGLIHLVRDPRFKEKDGERVCVDSGEEDKRLLVVTGEFASILAQLQRGENTLSSVLRDAWDGVPLQNNIRDSGRGGETCKEPHISISAHCTTTELLTMLTTTSIANGFGNRHLFVHTERVGELPLGGGMPSGYEWTTLAQRVGKICGHFDKPVRITPSAEAVALWRPVYSHLVREIDGDVETLADALCSRLEAHAWRLMALYAVLDQSSTIRGQDVRAATAVLDFCEATVRRMFASMTGDPVADRILRAVRKAGAEGLSRNDIYRTVCQKHVSRDDITGALKHLVGLGLVDMLELKTGGRPAIRVRATTGI